MSFVDMRHMVHSSGRYFCNVDDFTNIYTCKRLKYDIVQLPTEILVLIFRKLHIRDLLSVGQVCQHFWETILQHKSLYSQANLFECWPNTKENLSLFKRLAQLGNFEAMTKLALAKLYNQELPEDEMSIPMEQKAAHAMEYFDLAEQKVAQVPFTSLFIRPPWYSNGPCCKSLICQRFQDQLKHVKNPAIAFSIGQALELANDKHLAMFYFKMAAEQGYAPATLKIWSKEEYNIFLSKNTEDVGKIRDAVRKLRSIVRSQGLMCQLFLLYIYLQCPSVVMEHEEVLAHGRFVFSADSNPQFVRFCSTCDHQSRFILVDWMAEVSTLKGFTTQALSNAVAIVDQCLLRGCFSAQNLQLLAVVALVITSKHFNDGDMGVAILTVKEAAWLTDGTYTYTQVVKMMGDVMGLLKGQYRFVTCSDYISYGSRAFGLDPARSWLTNFLAESCLLHVMDPALCRCSLSKTAAACALVTRCLTVDDEPWPEVIKEAVGFSLSDLSECAYFIYCRSFFGQAKTDRCLRPLEAINERYIKLLPTIERISWTRLRRMLGICRPVQIAKVEALHRRHEITSPCKLLQTRRWREDDDDDESATTPPPDNSFVEPTSSLFNRDMLLRFNFERAVVEEEDVEMFPVTDAVTEGVVSSERFSIREGYVYVSSEVSCGEECVSSFGVVSSPSHTDNWECDSDPFDVEGPSSVLPCKDDLEPVAGQLPCFDSLINTPVDVVGEQSGPEISRQTKERALFLSSSTSVDLSAKQDSYVSDEKTGIIGSLHTLRQCAFPPTACRHSSMDSVHQTSDGGYSSSIVDICQISVKYHQTNNSLTNTLTQSASDELCSRNASISFVDCDYDDGVLNIGFIQDKSSKDCVDVQSGDEFSNIQHTEVVCIAEDGTKFVTKNDFNHPWSSCSLSGSEIGWVPSMSPADAHKRTSMPGDAVSVMADFDVHGIGTRPHQNACASFFEVDPYHRFNSPTGNTGVPDHSARGKRKRFCVRGSDVSIIVPSTVLQGRCDVDVFASESDMNKEKRCRSGILSAS